MIEIVDGKQASIEEQVVGWLAQQDLEVYLVGGSVRDRLLKRRVHDLDVAVGGDGLALARRLADRFRGAYYPLDEARKAGRAILTEEGGRRLTVDIAAFRGPDLASDLADRDFTINALAVDVRAPELVIDHHDGIVDLEASLIRPVSNDSMRNDPLRTLRAVRHAAELRFALAPQTEALIRRDGAGLSRVSGERIRDELARLLGLPCAAPYVQRLDHLGLLTTIVPELEPLRDLAQSPPHHWDGLTHSLRTVLALEGVLAQVLPDDVPRQDSEREADSESHRMVDDWTDHAREQLEALAPLGRPLQVHLAEFLGGERTRVVTLKLAALLHDTGKPSARSVDEGGRIRFIGHQEEGAGITCEVMRRLRFNKAEVHLGGVIVHHHMRPLLLASQDSVSRRAVYRFFRDTREAGVDVLLHALADHRATYPPDAEDDGWPSLVTLEARMLSDYWERKSARVSPPRLIDGNDVQRECRLRPGREIGQLLEAVREAQVSGTVRTREEALALVRERVSSTDKRPDGYPGGRRPVSGS